MEPVSVVVIVLLVVALVLLLLRTSKGPGPRPTPPGDWREAAVDDGVVVLDLRVEDPERPAVQRLVADVARRALQADPGLEEVEVRDRDRRVLGRMARPEPLPPPATVPDGLREPHPHRDRTPRAVRGATSAARPLPAPDPEIDVSVPGRPVADQFDLPPTVRTRVRDPERPLDVIRAILEAAGRDVRIDRDVAVTGDTAVAVVGAGSTTVAEELSNAFMRIQSSGAARGLVVRLGYADPALIRHREAAAPHVRHVTADGIQRMADAVEAGGDPLQFAVAPVVLR